MRVSREVMAQRHGEIISETSKMLRRRGVQGTSVADLMAAAGLTHGGFYKHFPSKDALVREATERSFADINGRFEERVKTKGAKQALLSYVDDYLKASHVKSPDQGCPVSSLSPDISREHQDIKRAYAGGLKSTLALIAAGLSGSVAQRKERAVELLALLSGALAMARAVGDEKMTAEIINSARKRAMQMIGARR